MSSNTYVTHSPTSALTDITRRGLLKGSAGAAIGACALAELRKSTEALASQGSDASVFTAGAFTSSQKTPYATVDVNCTFSESGLTEVSYEPMSNSDSDYFPLFEEPLTELCASIVTNGKTDCVDVISGATLCSVTIMSGVDACMLESLGISTDDVIEPATPQTDDYRTFSRSCPNVFSPIKLGTMELANRVVKSVGSSPWPDSTGSSIPVSIELYGTMADNGVILNLLAGGALSKCAILPNALEVEDMAVEDAMARIVPLIDRIHESGGKIGYQMCFGGLAPTVDDSVINETPVEEPDAFIETVGVSASRGKQVGFDCIEIKGASADGLNDFLTRRVNTREDEYGCQSIENRTRLFCRMIQKIKEVNGDDFPVGALINGVEENDATLGDNDKYTTIEESKQIAKVLVDAGADWIQLRVGCSGQEMNIWAPDVQHIVEDADGITGYGNMFDYTTHFEGMVDGSRSGFASFLPMVKEIKQVVDVPVGCAAYMNLRVGPDFIDQAIANGDIDLVFMNRPLNCDPELVAKMQDGRREDVIPCMKCMHCHDNIGINRTVPSSCRMNASSFNSLTDVMPEGLIPLPSQAPRNIMVIGAGPAGMETARVAAQRGHSVELYEAEPTLGGLLNFARGVKGDHEHFEDYLVYIEHQLDNEGVVVNLGTTVDASLVQEKNPDAVVIAVGGTRESRFEGVNVFSPEEAFGSQRLGNDVVILGASVQAIDFAAHLATRGKRVNVINEGTKTDIGKGQSGWFRTYITTYLYGRGGKIWNNATINSVNEKSVAVGLSSGDERVIPCRQCYRVLRHAAHHQLG